MSINYKTLRKQAEALSGVVKMLNYMVSEQDEGNYNDAELDDESADLINVTSNSAIGERKSMKTVTYKRVLPRDLFNESKLLKVLGYLSLWIEDRRPWMDGVSCVHDTSQTDNFICGQDQSDGSFFCKNIKFFVALDTELEIKVIQEIGDRFSAFAQIGDGEEVRIFAESFDIAPSREFADLVASYSLTQSN